MPRENRGGRGRRDERGRTGQVGDVVLSKSLSFTLRHGAIKEGLQIRPDGYANVQDLVSPFSIAHQPAGIIANFN